MKCWLCIHFYFLCTCPDLAGSHLFQGIYFKNMELQKLQDRTFMDENV